MERLESFAVIRERDRVHDTLDGRVSCGRNGAGQIGDRTLFFHITNENILTGELRLE
jgi:hypothetical protein